MGYIKPVEVVKSMVAAGATKGALPVKDLLVHGLLSGALPGFATSLALSAAVQTGYPIVGALVFPVGFIMIVLLGLELPAGKLFGEVLAEVQERCMWREFEDDVCLVGMEVMRTGIADTSRRVA